MQLHPPPAVSSWSLSGWLASTTLATIAFWSMFGACVDASDVSASDGAASLGAPPSARAIVSWDARECGPPHRVIVELEPRAAPKQLRSGSETKPGGGSDTESGGEAPLATSVPCAIGEVTLEVPRAGIYEGRAYAWSADATMRSMTSRVLALDAPVTRWEVPTPR